MRFLFVRAEKAKYPLTVLCRLLDFRERVLCVREEGAFEACEC